MPEGAIRMARNVAWLARSLRKRASITLRALYSARIESMCEAERIGRFLRGLWRQIRSWRERRAALAQLRALDDAALKDIGLHRSGIEAAVLGPRPGTAPRQPRHFPQKPHLWLQRTG